MREFSYIFKRWRLFFIYVAFLYLTLPFAPRWWENIRASLGQIAEELPFIMLGVSLCIILFKFLLKKKRYVFRGLFLICLVFYIIFLIVKRVPYPAEKIHVLEYVLLSVIIYAALKKNQPIKAIYFKTSAIGFVVGFFDEVIQYLLPSRVFDLRDIFLNVSSLILGQVLIYSIKDMP